jgi:hypothetical protein
VNRTLMLLLGLAICALSIGLALTAMYLLIDDRAVPAAFLLMAAKCFHASAESIANREGPDPE